MASCGQTMNYSFGIQGLCGVSNKDQIALDENEIVNNTSYYNRFHKNVVVQKLIEDSQKND